MARSFLKDVISVGASKILMILFGMGSSIVTARFLGPEGNGLIAALIVYPSLFMSIGSLGIRQSTTYFLGKGIYSEEQIKTAITQIWGISSLFSIVVSFVLIRHFSDSGSNILLVMLALAPLPFSLFNTYNSGIFLGKNEIGMFNRINWIPSLIVFLLTFLFVAVLQFDVSGAMVASIGGPLFMFFILLFKNNFIAAFNFRFNWSIIRSMLSLGIVYAISLLIINLNYKADIILLDKLSSPYELGIYSKGAIITEYLWQIPMLFSTIIFARSAVSKNQELFSYKVAQLLRVSFVIVGLASCVLVLFSDEIISLLYGNAFKSSATVLKYLLPGVLILTIYKVMNMDLAGRGKPWVSLKAMVPSLVINIILNFIFIPQFGANGSALASTISYSLAAILFLHFYSKEVGISVKVIFKYSREDFKPIFLLFNKKRNNENV